MDSFVWQQATQPDQKPEKRLRLLAALAAFDPDGPGWEKASGLVLQPWLSDNPLYLGGWTEARATGDDGYGSRFQVPTYGAYAVLSAAHWPTRPSPSQNIAG